MSNDLKKLLEQIEEIRNTPPIRSVEASVDEGLPTRRIKMYYGQKSIPKMYQRMRNKSDNENLYHTITRDYDLDTSYMSEPDQLYLKYTHRKPAYIPSTKIIIGNNEHAPHVLARELSFAIKDKKHPMLDSIVTTLDERGLHLGAPIGGALLLNDETAPYAGIGMAAPYIPGLVREYQVNKQALDLLKEVGYTQEALAGKKSLMLTGAQQLNRPLKALGIGTGLGLLVKYLSDRINRKQNNLEKTASATFTPAEQKIRETIIEAIKNNPEQDIYLESPEATLPHKLIRIFYGQEEVPNAAVRTQNIRDNINLVNHTNKKYDLDVLYLGAPNNVYEKTKTPFYSSNVKAIFGNNEHAPHILAHELGHAITDAKYPKLYKFLSPVRKHGTPLGAVIGGTMLTNEDTAPYAGVGAASPHLAVLADEAIASKRGLNLLKELNHTADTLKTGKKALLLSGMTYVPNAAKALGIGTGVGLLTNYIRKRKKFAQDNLEKTANVVNEIKTISNTLAKVPKAPIAPVIKNGITTMNIGGKSITGQADLLRKLNFADQNMFQRLGKHLDVSSGFRSVQDQQKLVNRIGNGRAIPGIVAPPGQSVHNVGAGFDITNWQEAQPFLNQAGFSNPLANDRIHFRPSNFQNERQIIDYYRKGIF